ncbi:hypothetical protein J6590_104576 [Homalodisca vitripennis]|nr:hypothetical protein J6590_104576 [Homalodisca vitripennis]
MINRGSTRQRGGDALPIYHLSTIWAMWPTATRLLSVHARLSGDKLQTALLLEYV